MAKLNINAFLNLTPEQQAKAVERMTKDVIKRLPTLKKQLKMYGEVSDEMYNLSADELELQGSTYSRAIRSGEISTPSSRSAYQSFIKNLHKYSRMDISKLAQMTAEQRLDSWQKHINANASEEEKKYVEELLKSMTDKQKLGFTRSEYFLDVENWSSQGFIQDTDSGKFSISTLKLELYLETYGDETQSIYNTEVATDGQQKLRGAFRGRKARKRSK